MECLVCKEESGFYLKFSNCKTHLYCKDCYFDLLTQDRNCKEICKLCWNWTWDQKLENACGLCGVVKNREIVRTCKRHYSCQECIDEMYVPFVKYYPQVKACKNCRFFFLEEMDPDFNICLICRGKKPLALACSHKICIKCVSNSSRPMVQELIELVNQCNSDRINSQEFIVKCPYPICSGPKCIIPAECILNELSEGLEGVVEHWALLNYKLDGVLCMTENIDGKLFVKGLDGEFLN